MQYTQIPGLTAGADLSALQYTFVKLEAGNGNQRKIVAVTGPGQRPLGVLQNNPKEGEPANVAITGMARVKCGAAISYGGSIKANTIGRAIPVTGLSNSASTFSLGFVLEDGVAGQIVDVLLTYPAYDAT